MCDGCAYLPVVADPCAGIYASRQGCATATLKVTESFCAHTRSRTTPVYVYLRRSFVLTRNFLRVSLVARGRAVEKQQHDAPNRTGTTTMDSDRRKFLGHQIARARKRLRPDNRQEDVAELTGLSLRRVGGVERGEDWVSDDTIGFLLDFFRLDHDTGEPINKDGIGVDPRMPAVVQAKLRGISANVAAMDSSEDQVRLADALEACMYAEIDRISQGRDNEKAAWPAG